MHLKMSSAKWQPFCLSLNVPTSQQIQCVDKMMTVRTSLKNGNSYTGIYFWRVGVSILQLPNILNEYHPVTAKSFGGIIVP